MRRISQKKSVEEGYAPSTEIGEEPPGSLCHQAQRNLCIIEHLKGAVPESECFKKCRFVRIATVVQVYDPEKQPEIVIITKRSRCYHKPGDDEDLSIVRCGKALWASPKQVTIDEAEAAGKRRCTLCCRVKKKEKK